MPRSTRALSVALAFLMLGAIACNPSNSAYYATKFLWSRPLHSPARVDILLDATLTSSIDRWSSPEYLTLTDAEYEQQLIDALLSKFSQVENLTLTDSLPDFEVLITSVHLREYQMEEECEGELFDLTHLSTQLNYEVYETSSGSKIGENDADCSEGESLKTKYPDDAPAYCTYRIFQNIGFHNLIPRMADKVAAKSTNYMRDHQETTHR